MKAKYFYIAIFIACLFFPHLALASDFFTVSDDDIAKKLFINSVFGSLAGGDESSPWGNVIGVFNGGVLIIGGIWLSYIYLAGTAQGAHDGQFLGKRWSSLWVPIRMLLGTTLAFPSLKGGFCLAQWLVIWLATQGIGFANGIWSAYTSNAVGGTSVASISNEAKTYALTRQMFLNNLCLSLSTLQLGANGAAQGAEKEALDGIFGATTFVPRTTTDTSNGFNTQIHYSMEGDANPSKKVNEVCGLASFTARGLAKDGNSTTGKNGQTTTVSDPGSLTGTEITTVSNQVQSANSDIQKAAYDMAIVQNTALLQLQVATKAVAESYAQDQTQDPTPALNAIAVVYKTALDVAYQAEVAKLAESSKAWSDSIKQDGFIMAGAYYMKIAKLQEALSEAMDNFPIISSPAMMTKDMSFRTKGNWLSDLGNDDMGTSGNTVFMNFFVQIRGYYANAATKTADARIQNSPYTNQDIGTSNKKSEGVFDFFGKIMNGDDVNPEEIFSTQGADASDPLALSIQIGTKLESWSSVVIFVGLAAGFLNGGIATFAISIWLLLIVPAKILTTVVPLMPYMIWIGGCFSWFVLLMEAFIAAPIWATSHLSPEGDGFQGQAKMGYMLLISLTLRPALMVFGLIAAIIAMNPIGQLIQGTFGLAFGSVVSGSSSYSKAMSVAAGGFIYALVMLTTVKKVFELIHVVPDRIMKWMGGTESGLSHGAEFGAEGMQAARIGQSALGGIGSQAKNLASSLKPKPKLDGDKDKDKDKGDGGGGGSDGGSGASPGGGSNFAASIRESEAEGASSAVPLSKGGSSGGSSGASGSSGAGQDVSSLKDTARSHQKASQASLSNALAKNPELAQKYQEAKQSDGQARTMGQKGNAVSTLLSAEVAQAKAQQAEGKPLASYQKSLLNSARSAGKQKSIEKDISKMPNQE